MWGQRRATRLPPLSPSLCHHQGECSPHHCHLPSALRSFTGVDSWKLMVSGCWRSFGSGDFASGAPWWWRGVETLAAAASFTPVLSAHSGQLWLLTISTRGSCWDSGSTNQTWLLPPPPERSAPAPITGELTSCFLLWWFFFFQLIPDPKDLEVNKAPMRSLFDWTLSGHGGRCVTAASPL